MPKFEVITDPTRFRQAEEVLRFYCETSSGLVKKMGFEPIGDAAVAKTSWGTVCWMFATPHDQEIFFAKHKDFVLIKGKGTAHI